MLQRGLSPAAMEAKPAKGRELMQVQFWVMDARQVLEGLLSFTVDPKCCLGWRTNTESGGELGGRETSLWYHLGEGQQMWPTREKDVAKDFLCANLLFLYLLFAPFTQTPTECLKLEQRIWC